MHAIIADLFSQLTKELCAWLGRVLPKLTVALDNAKFQVQMARRQELTNEINRQQHPGKYEIMVQFKTLDGKKHFVPIEYRARTARK